jgi:hypothetical protein
MQRANSASIGRGKILLPLRTSAEFFSDPRQPSALTRAKQAAVLYDTVVIEGGFLEVLLMEHRSRLWWTPSYRVTPQNAELARNPAKDGLKIDEPFYNEDRVSVSYGAEWISEVLLPLHLLGADDFIEEVDIGDDGALMDALESATAGRNKHDASDSSLMPNTGRILREFVYSSFNYDAAVAARIGATLQVSTLFEPMLRRHGRRPTGTTALEIIVPNLTALDWETVLKFRQHPGTQEARHILRGLEHLAIEQEPDDAREFLLKISQETASYLNAALSDRATHLPRAVVEEALKTGISFIPVIGPFAQGAMSAAELGAHKLKESRSGIAALMKLREG